LFPVGVEFLPGEHAWCLNYQSKRVDYLAAVTKVINWDFVGERYEALAK
jgi:Fe-Mn family superoxide dismutase